MLPAPKSGVSYPGYPVCTYFSIVSPTENVLHTCHLRPLRLVVPTSGPHGRSQQKGTFKIWFSSRGLELIAMGCRNEKPTRQTFTNPKKEFQLGRSLVSMCLATGASLLESRFPELGLGKLFHDKPR
ncbi:hypothetical protein AFLA_001638 [Aspergillus flavus NRRL3357]|nr:hypothetical protein AFLA_001638 [Aspergillus flavus NRRL3357]